MLSSEVEEAFGEDALYATRRVGCFKHLFYVASL